MSINHNNNQQFLKSLHLGELKPFPIEERLLAPLFSDHLGCIKLTNTKDDINTLIDQHVYDSVIIDFLGSTKESIKNELYNLMQANVKSSFKHNISDKHHDICYYHLLTTTKPGAGWPFLISMLTFIIVPICFVYYKKPHK